MKKVIIFGTAHTYQFTNDVKLAMNVGSIANELSKICDQHCVVAIAEEMNLQAIAAKGAIDSTVRQLAAQRQLMHRYVDPDLTKRAELGIDSDTDIRLKAFFSSVNLTPDEIEVLVQESHRIRERYWLDRLVELDSWPVLFVCGANHALPFKQLLTDNGISVIVHVEDWTATTSAVSTMP